MKFSFKEFFISMYTDSEGGGISSKRFWGSVGMIVYVALAFINTYTNFKTPVFIMDGFMYIIIAAFFGSTMEYFSKRNTSTSVKVGDDANVTVNTPVTPAPTKPPVTPTPAPAPVPKPVPKTVVTPKEPVWIVPTDEENHIDVVIEDKNLNE